MAKHSQSLYGAHSHAALRIDRIQELFNHVDHGEKSLLGPSEAIGEVGEGSEIGYLNVVDTVALIFAPNVERDLINEEHAAHLQCADKL